MSEQKQDGLDLTADEREQIYSCIGNPDSYPELPGTVADIVAARLAAAGAELGLLRADVERFRPLWASPLAAPSRWVSAPIPYPRRYVSTFDVLKTYDESIRCSSDWPQAKRHEAMDRALHAIPDLAYEIDYLRQDLDQARAETNRLRIVDATRWARMERVWAVNDDLRAELADAKRRLGAVAALHVPWYEIAGVRHEHRVLVAWDEAPDDHVCVIGRTATVMDVCEPGDTHAVLACAECRASGGDDTDVAHYPFYPCATAAVLGPVSGAVETRCATCGGSGQVSIDRGAGPGPSEPCPDCVSGAVEGAGDEPHDFQLRTDDGVSTRCTRCDLWIGKWDGQSSCTSVARHEQEVRADDDERPVDLNAIADHLTDLVDQIGEVGIWGDYGPPAAPVSYVVQVVLDNASAIENRTGDYVEEATS
jgi:hypothetical protein